MPVFQFGLEVSTPKESKIYIARIKANSIKSAYHKAVDLILDQNIEYSFEQFRFEMTKEERHSAFTTEPTLMNF